jgi:TM2 domain-containing membrane protein YozV
MGPPPGAPMGPPPGAPYGYDQYGQPLSDKSKVVAGLLQLVPGFFFGIGGIGRLYSGDTNLGIIQLVATIVGWACLVCGFFLLFLPWLISAAVWLWFVVDGILLLAGNPRDRQGRLLRA